MLLLVLALLSAAFLWFALEGQAPWEGDSLKRVAKRLELPKEEVPLQIFFDFETLGSQNLGVDIYRQIGLWQGAVLVGVVLLICALTARWWLPLTRRRPRLGSLLPAATESATSTFRAGRIGWISFALILLLASWLRVPHLDRSLYFDEQDNLRRNFHGYLEIQPDGEEVWMGAEWSEALWENKLGNNPVMLSALAQVSLRTWRAVTGADRQRYNVVALRMPVLLAGLGSIASLWFLLQLWELRTGAFIAAALAAVSSHAHRLQSAGTRLRLGIVVCSAGCSFCLAGFAQKTAGETGLLWLSVSFSVFGLMRVRFILPWLLM